MFKAIGRAQDQTNLKQDLLPGSHRREQGGWSAMTIPGSSDVSSLGFGRIHEWSDEEEEFLERTVLLSYGVGRPGSNTMLMLMSALVVA